jgi:predicted PurR-regulated permease PerM
LAGNLTTNQTAALTRPLGSGGDAKERNPGRRLLVLFLRLGIVMLIIAGLYFGRSVFIPLLLALLAAFLLDPLVKWIERLRLSRTASVVVVCLAACAGTGTVAWLLGREVHKLAAELPRYAENIQARLETVQRVTDNNVFGRLVTMFEDLTERVWPERPAEQSATSRPQLPGGTAAAPEEPVPVVVRSGMGEKWLGMAAGPFMQVLATAAIVTVLTFFFLLRWRDLRQRLRRVMDPAQTRVTEEAVDEASRRISRYLLTQTALNASYGLVLAGGLYLIGLPYALFWGVLAFLFRFIPYVGPWLGATLPFAVSLAVFPGWVEPLMVAGLIAVIELGTNMLLEPLLYANSAGLSDVAVLIAILLWTWLWGPIGIILATPLTVCLVAVCKHVPELQFLEVLLGRTDEKPRRRPRGRASIWVM